MVGIAIFIVLFGISAYIFAELCRVMFGSENSKEAEKGCPGCGRPSGHDDHCHYNGYYN